MLPAIDFFLSLYIPNYVCTWKKVTFKCARKNSRENALKCFHKLVKLIFIEFDLISLFWIKISNHWSSKKKCMVDRKVIQNFIIITCNCCLFTLTQHHYNSHQKAHIENIKSILVDVSRINAPTYMCVCAFYSHFFLPFHFIRNIKNKFPQKTFASVKETAGSNEHTNWIVFSLFFSSSYSE